MLSPSLAPSSFSFLLSLSSSLFLLGPCTVTFVNLSISHLITVVLDSCRCTITDSVLYNLNKTQQIQNLSFNLNKLICIGYTVYEINPFAYTNRPCHKIVGKLAIPLTWVIYMFGIWLQILGSDPPTTQDANALLWPVKMLLYDLEFIIILL